MMLKLLGAVFIIFSTSFAGIYFSTLDRYHLEDLEELKKGLTILKNQVCFSSMPLYEALKDISKRTEGAVSDILYKISNDLEQKAGETAAEIWSEAWSQNKEKTYLSKDDLELLYSFGRTLGYLDRQQQIANVDITIASIEFTQDMLRRRYEKNSKIYRSMGVLSGVLIAVVLI